MKDLDKVKLLDIDAYNSVMWVGSWHKFVDDNIDAGMEREEIDNIAGSLDRGEMHIFGGGASALFGLRKTEEIPEEWQGFVEKYDGVI